MYWLGQTAAYGNRIVCNTPPPLCFCSLWPGAATLSWLSFIFIQTWATSLEWSRLGSLYCKLLCESHEFFFYSLRPLFFSPELQLQACQEDIFIPSLWNRIQPVKKSSSSSFVVVEKIDGAGGERAFMFYLTAVKDITKALEARCVSSNQLIRPSVSRKKKQLMIFFFRVLLANSCFPGLIFLFFFPLKYYERPVNFDFSF